MNLTVLIKSMAQNSGGVREVVKDLYKYISSDIVKNMKVLSLKYDDYSVLESKEWKSVSSKVYDRTICSYSRDLRDDLFKSNTNILHLHGLFGYPHFLANQWKRNNPDSKLIISPHGMLDEYAVGQRSKLKNSIGDLLFVNTSFSIASCFVALNESEYNSIRNYGAKLPIAIINNGVTIPDIEIVRDLNKRSKRLLFLSRLHPKKGLDILIDAFCELKMTNPELGNWVLDIVGWDDNSYANEMKKKVVKYGLSDKIFFHGGLWGDDKKEVFKQADAFILPSHSEGLPMSVLEAWSYSLPVIMTEACNIPVGFSKNAAIKITPTKQSVMRGLVDLFEMPDEDLIKMGCNGYKLVQSTFSWKLIASQMEQLYNWTLL